MWKHLVARLSPCFRSTFTVPAASSSSALRLKGINYGANIWVNGKLLASGVGTKGTYRYVDVPLYGIAQVLTWFPNRSCSGLACFAPKRKHTRIVCGLQLDGIAMLHLCSHVPVLDLS